MPGPQNVPKIRLSKKIFHNNNHLNLSTIEFHVEICTHLGEQFLLLIFSDNYNFQTFHFLTLCPIFVNSKIPGSMFNFDLLK